MCARADYREGFRVLAAELRRMVRDIRARWRGRSPGGAAGPANAGRIG